MKASWEAREQFLKAKIKGYIHGFTENYVKVKLRGIRLVNTLHEINLTTIDTDGSVRSLLQLRYKHFKIIYLNY
jgi:hypothetical protein